MLLEPGVRPPLVLPALQVQAHEVAPLEGRAQQGDLAGRVLRVGLIVELSQARNRVRFSDSFTTKRARLMICLKIGDLGGVEQLIRKPTMTEQKNKQLAT